MGCLCAIETDEYHGFECSVSGGACMYLYPDSKRCAREYGEGPDVGNTENMEEYWYFSQAMLLCNIAVRCIKCRKYICCQKWQPS